MYYHLTTDHSLTTLLFRDDEDRLFFINRMALLAILMDLRIYAYCLMDNHIHLLISGEEDVIRRFFSLIKKDYAQYVTSKYGNKSSLDRFLPELKQIPSKEYFRSVVAYILRNPFKAGMSCPYCYQWNSAWIYFRQPFWEMAEKTIKEYGLKQFKQMLHTRKVPDNILMCGDVISPRHWILYSKVEEIFGTSSDLFNSVSRRNTENDTESFLLQKEICSYPDAYLLKVIEGYCKQYGASKVNDLDSITQRKLISRLARQYGSSRKQIGRLTGADEETILRFA